MPAEGISVGRGPPMAIGPITILQRKMNRIAAPIIIAPITIDVDLPMRPNMIHPA